MHSYSFRYMYRILAINTLKLELCFPFCNLILASIKIDRKKMFTFYRPEAYLFVSLPGKCNIIVEAKDKDDVFLKASQIVMLVCIHF